MVDKLFNSFVYKPRLQNIIALLVIFVFCFIFLFLFLTELIFGVFLPFKPLVVLTPFLSFLFNKKQILGVIQLLI